MDVRNDKPLAQANDNMNKVNDKLKQTPVTATTRLSTNNKNKRNRWTKEEQVELYHCYCEARKLNLKSLTKGTYEIWRERNPYTRPHMDPNKLATQRRYSKKSSLTESERKDIERKVMGNEENAPAKTAPVEEPVTDSTNIVANEQPTNLTV